MYFKPAIIVNFCVDRCFGRNVLSVGNVHHIIVDSVVLEAFRKYRDDLRTPWAIILK